MSERRALAPATGLQSIPGPPPRTRPAAVPPPPPKVARTAPSAPPPAGGTTTQGGAQRAQQRPSQESRPRPAEASPVRATTFTLPVQLRDQIRAASTERGVTLAELVLGAIERTQHHLSDLVAEERPPASQTSGGLFPDTPRSARRSTEARVTISIRLSAANLEVLDQLVVQHHADNRSQLITAALRGDLSN